MLIIIAPLSHNFTLPIEKLKEEVHANTAFSLPLILNVQQFGKATKKRNERLLPPKQTPTIQ